ncbi:ribokinase [Xanthomonadaceae bacterium JHOS43]|nr:ribokinase [Xanthomonadaceae bacterium JHOS43]
MKSRVAIVGSYNQDFIWRTEHFPVPGETRLGRFATGPGGKGFNQAVAAARQGAQVTFIGALGRDAVGEGAAALAKTENIDARWQWCDDAASGTAAIVLDASGQNLIIVGSGANLALSVAHVETHADAIASAAVTLVQHEVTPAATRRALEHARTAGVATILNPAPPLPSEDGALLALVDVLTPNETEFAHLLACCAGVDVDANLLLGFTDAELHALARRLPVATVVLTLGSGGVFVSHGESHRWADSAPYYRMPAEAVHPRDTTGAGDAFSGALAAALSELQDAAFSAAVAHANRVAGLATESPGAASAMPTRAAVHARFG